MSAYLAFTKKEGLAVLRNGKLLLLTVIFLLLGLMNPLIAKFTPDLISSLSLEGITLTVPTPTAFDSWTQYYKNLPQFGLIILVIVFSSSLTSELTKGTLVNMLTKGLPRTTVIFSKLTVSGLLWTLGNLLAFAVTYAYTAFYWPTDLQNHLFLAASFLWLFGIFLLASIYLGSVLFFETSGTLLFCGGLVACLFLANIFPKVSEYNPLYLVSQNLQLINGSLQLSDFYPAILVTLIWIIFSLIASCLIFNKKAL
ncbi:ABC transporter permease [Enterococcus sp. LJL120]